MRSRRCSLLLPLAVGMVAALPASAGAAVTATYDPDAQKLTVTGDGNDNAIALTCVSNIVRVNGSVTNPAATCDVAVTSMGWFVIDGGGGDDTIDLTSPTYADFKNIGWDNPVIKGGPGDDTIKGALNEGNPIGVRDEIDGGPGNDTIYGGVGDDTIIGGPGHNVINGQGDDDTIVEGGDVNAGYGGTSFNWGADSDALTSVERISFTGGASGNAVNLASWTGASSIHGAGGPDLLTGGSGADGLYGEAGGDTLVGNAGKDQIEGGADNDTLQGFAGDDLLKTGTGQDTAQGGPDADTIDMTGAAAGSHAYGDQGTDTVRAGGSGTLTDGAFGATALTSIDRAELRGTTIDAGAFSGYTELIAEPYGVAADLRAGKGGSRLVGSAQGDHLTGGPGGDKIEAGTGDDVITGGPGIDDIEGFSGDDVLSEKSFPSNVSFNVVGYTAPNGDKAWNIDRMELTGTEGPDVIDAGGYNGKLKVYGLGGDDTLKGGAGTDVLDAGAGVDTLDGRGGADVIAARNGTLTKITCDGVDTGERDDADQLTGKCPGVLGQSGPVLTQPKPPAPPALPGVPGGKAGGTSSGGAVAPGAGTVTGTTGVAPVRPRPAGLDLMSAKTKLRDGMLGVKLRCGAGAPCEGFVRAVSAKRVKVKGRVGRFTVAAPTRYRLAAGVTSTVWVRFGSTGRTLLRRPGALRVVVSAGAGVQKTVAVR